MDILFKRLSEINIMELIELMNNPLVYRHLPLATGRFNKDDCDKFIATKEQLWVEFGYGPWAFMVNGKFVGWGGLQPENGEADLAMVLHPDYWGIGRVLYEKIIKEAFDTMGLETITILLPLTRKRVRGILKLGFKKGEIIEISGETFMRYRLLKTHHQI